MSLQIPQTSYSRVPPVAFAGMLADNANTRILSALAEVALDAGMGVVRGTAQTTQDGTTNCKLPTLATDVTNLFLGVAKYEAIKEPVSGSANRFAAHDPVPVIAQGTVWVQAEATMTEEGAVYLVNGSGAGTPGKFRGDANSGAATLVAGAKCKIGVTGAGIASVLFNAP